LQDRNLLFTKPWYKFLSGPTPRRLIRRSSPETMNTSMKSLALLTALVALTSPALQAAGSDWPQWRGADRTDLSPETGLLKSWPEGGPKRVWLY
jgi:hypothetical protein